MSYARTRVILVAAVALAGCGNIAAPHRIAALSTSDHAGNAAKVADFIQQQCFDRADNLKQFEAGLQATGWQSKRTQTADPANPLELDVWEFSDLTLMRGQPVTNGAWTCSVSVKAPVAPTPDQMRAALSAIIGQGPDKSGEWWANSNPTHRLHIDLGSTANAGDLFLNVEIYRLPWWRRILG